MAAPRPEMSTERGLLPGLREVLWLLIKLLLDPPGNFTKDVGPGGRRRRAN